MRKTIITILIILFVALLGWAVWYFVINDNPETEGNPFSNVLPFGSGEGVEFPSQFGQNGAQGLTPGVEGGKPTQALFRVTNAPISGFVLLGEGASTTVRYTDRGTGHIYNTNLTTLETEKILNSTLPRVYEAIYSDDGRRVVYRSIDDTGFVRNLSITLTPPNSTSTSPLYTFTSVALTENIDEIVSGKGNVLYYVLKDIPAIVSSNFDGNGKTTLLDSKFSSWRIDPAGSSLIVWSKASSNTPGYAYSLSLGNLSKEIDQLNGLAVKAGPGGELAFSYKSDGKVQFAAQNSQSGISYEILPATLAEKCVWSSLEINTLFCGVPIGGLDVNEPDNWYKGIAHFSDRIWKFETAVDISKILSEPKQIYELDIDAENLALSQDEGYLLFINRNDLSLWALKLE